MHHVGQYTAPSMENTPASDASGHIHVAPPTHDRVACWRWWQGLRAQTPPAWLHEEVGRRMQERLQWIKMQPRDWIHAQPSLGGFDAHRLIRDRYPKAACQITEPGAHRLALSRSSIEPSLWRAWWPLGPRTTWVDVGAAPEPADMLWANMQLHLHPEPQTLLRQWHDALRTDGFLMFSGLGPDALNELHDFYRKLGWPAPGPQWTDMHDWGDMLVQSGFAEPVMDMERIILTYATPEAMVADLRTLGRNLHPQRHPACKGRGWLARWRQEMDDHWPHRGPDGQFCLTFEIVYGHALKPKPRHSVDTTTRISLGEMKNMLRTG